MQNFFIFFILFLIIERIKGHWEYVSEQLEIATSPWPGESNITKTLDASTTPLMIDDEKFNDYELKKLFIKKFKIYQENERERMRNNATTIMNTLRKSRAALVPTLNPKPASNFCYKCYASGTTAGDENCYRGEGLTIAKCADAEICYTEVHPKFVRRGCMLSEMLNRTFVCNCPLCNDKSTAVARNHEYTSITDWAFDNMRLGKALDMKLPCKVCKTKGMDLSSDRNCRSGKTMDFITCPANHLCYTNIDDETDFVSRGCIRMPAFNSLYFFCNTSTCNKNSFLRPKDRIKQEVISIRLPNIRFRSTMNCATQASIAMVLFGELFVITLF